MEVVAVAVMAVVVIIDQHNGGPSFSSLNANRETE